MFADWRQLLETAALDVLWVCTPPRVHAGPAIAALDRGLPLYLEKPIARSPGDARAIADAAARGGTVCAVGYQWHAVEALDDLRLALAGRTIGCLVGQSIGGTQSRPWFLDMAAGGGNLLERGSHHIDLARAVAGEVVAVRRPRRRSGWRPGRPGLVTSMTRSRCCCTSRPGLSEPSWWHGQPIPCPARTGSRLLPTTRCSAWTWTLTTACPAPRGARRSMWCREPFPLSDQSGASLPQCAQVSRESSSAPRRCGPHPAVATAAEEALASGTTVLVRTQ